VGYLGRKMARPPKEPHLRKDADLRIPLTADQKRLIVHAANLAQSDVATWLRPIILQAASEWVARAGGNSAKSERRRE
jgi:uncharacterized protein (DUF1778 family)